MARYKTYRAGDKKIIVVSSYAGKAVRGVAKCNPEDAFDEVKGEKLARLRCDEKIAQKRVARSQAAYKKAAAEVAAAQQHLNDMKDYVKDAAFELGQIQISLKQLESEM